MPDDLPDPDLTRSVELVHRAQDGDEGALNQLFDRYYERVRRIVDVKCPSSGELEGNRLENLDLVGDRDEVKFVIADRGDYEWAASLVRERQLTERCTVLFSVVHGELDLSRLAAWVLEDRLRVTVQTQLHKLLFGPETRGV